jgi:hypothetical protein
LATANTDSSAPASSGDRVALDDLPVGDREGLLGARAPEALLERAAQRR